MSPVVSLVSLVRSVLAGYTQILRHPWKMRGLTLVLTVLLLSASGCSRPPEPQAAKPPNRPTQFDPSLTFEDVKLEQVDENGQKRWALQADKVIYSRDRKLAWVEGLSGKLYNEGEHAYDAKAKRGVLYQDGKRIILSEGVEAKDLKDGTVFKANELEWLPDEDVMLFQGNMSAVHAKGSMTAVSGRLLEKDRLLELKDKVIIQTKEPVLKLATNQGVWQMDKQMVLANGNLMVERYQNEVVTDRAIAQKGSLDLEIQLITLDEKAQLSFADPPVLVGSNKLLWDLPGQALTSNVPLSILNQASQVALNGQKGRMDLANKVLYLTEGIEALAEANQSRLTANNLTWFMANQTFKAVGNVVYTQNNPQFFLRGEQADGRLEDKTFVVTGGDSKVVTEIIPDKPF